MEYELKSCIAAPMPVASESGQPSSRSTFTPSITILMSPVVAPSTSHCECASATAARKPPARPLIEAVRACDSTLANLGKANAARMPRMVMTTTSSIRVKPACFVFIVYSSKVSDSYQLGSFEPSVRGRGRYPVTSCNNGSCSPDSVRAVYKTCNESGIADASIAPISSRSNSHCMKL